jgi:hypothetical protein
MVEDPEIVALMDKLRHLQQWLREFIDKPWRKESLGAPGELGWNAHQEQKSSRLKWEYDGLTGDFKAVFEALVVLQGLRDGQPRA